MLHLCTQFRQARRSRVGLGEHLNRALMQPFTRRHIVPETHRTRLDVMRDRREHGCAVDDAAVDRSDVTGEQANAITRAQRAQWQRCPCGVIRAFAQRGVLICLGFGRVTVGADGSYRFRTIRPVAYSGRTPHIHVKVKLGRRDLLITQLYVADDPDNSRDLLWRSLSAADRAALTTPFVQSGDGLKAQFPLFVSA